MYFDDGVDFNNDQKEGKLFQNDLPAESTKRKPYSGKKRGRKPKSEQVTVKPLKIENTSTTITKWEPLMAEMNSVHDEESQNGICN